VAVGRPPEMSPWRRRPLTIPPNSRRAWVSLVMWEAWMGALLYSALHFGRQLLITAWRASGLNALLNFWCGLLLLFFCEWLLWELWNAVAPTPITDDFLKLLDDSFARDWRNPRTWPWSRVAWAYGFTLAAAVSAAAIGALIPTR